MADAPKSSALPKVFLIGFNKCGTQTFHHFFKANGYRSVHYEKGRLALKIFENLSNGVGLLQGYEDYHVFTDMEFISHEFAFEAYKLFPQFSREFSDAIFVLQTRDVENWIRSRFNYGTYSNRWKRVLKVEDDRQLADVWREHWRRHHERVTNYFDGSEYRFFRFDIEKDRPEIIAEKIPEYKLEPRKFVVRGKTPPKSPDQALASRAGLSP